MYGGWVGAVSTRFAFKSRSRKPTQCIFEYFVPSVGSFNYFQLSKEDGFNLDLKESKNNVLRTLHLNHPYHQQFTYESHTKGRSLSLSLSLSRYAYIYIIYIHTRYVESQNNPRRYVQTASKLGTSIYQAKDG